MSDDTTPIEELNRLPLDDVPEIPPSNPMDELRLVIHDEVQRAIDDKLPRAISDAIKDERQHTANLVNARVGEVQNEFTRHVSELTNSFMDSVRGMLKDFRSDIKVELAPITATIQAQNALIGARDDAIKEIQDDLNEHTRDIKLHASSMAGITSKLDRITDALFGREGGAAGIFDELKTIKATQANSVAQSNQRLEMMERWQREQQRIYAEAAARRERMMKVALYAFNTPTLKWLLLLAGGATLGIGGYDLIKLLIGG